MTVSWWTRPARSDSLFPLPPHRAAMISAALLTAVLGVIAAAKSMAPRTNMRAGWRGRDEQAQFFAAALTVVPVLARVAGVRRRLSAS